jgi:hypothetical protein
MIDLTPFVNRGTRLPDPDGDTLDSKTVSFSAIIEDQRYVADLAMAEGNTERFTMTLNGTWVIDFTGFIRSIHRGEGSVVHLSVVIVDDVEQRQAA